MTMHNVRKVVIFFLTVQIYNHPRLLTISLKINHNNKYTYLYLNMYQVKHVIKHHKHF